MTLPVPQRHLSPLARTERSAVKHTPMALIDFTDLASLRSSIMSAGKSLSAVRMPPEEPAGDFFGDDIYVREWKAKKGSFVMGRVHATNHVFIMISGRMVTWTEKEGLGVLEGPCIFEGKAGSQRVLFTLTDVHLATSHGLPGVYDLQPNREEMKELMSFVDYNTFKESSGYSWADTLSTFITNKEATDGTLYVRYTP